ncbi:receptor expression-enhancing protein 4 [Halyomorpha halys]|uniref:receptor expression-enhancing protein 4 n=1 Tax=Halyomorpha halys TaxID=286706 RepID=UPI0006D4CF4A
MITALISRLVILGLGTLYPAYASYKAVRTKDVKEYVKWMMYWIVFALFTFAETFTDVLFSFWFPFYYEIKVALVLWLLSPATKGSSFLYRNFVHPAFLKRESEIDEMLAKAKERGYSTVVSLGSKGVTYATNVILQTAMKGGGGLVEHIRKSYSLTDLAPRKSDRFIRPDETDAEQVREEDDEVPERPVLRRRPIGSPGVDMRFKEFDVNMRQLQASSGPLNDIQSTEDISSGYSSTDQLYTSPSEMMLTRSSSVTRGRGGRTSRSTQPKKIPLTEETEDDDYEACEVIPESYPLPPPSHITSIIRKFSNPSPIEEIPVKVKDLMSLYEAQNPSLMEQSCSMLSCVSQSSLVSNSSEKYDRKGKYGKYQAPKPPSQDAFSFTESLKIYEKSVSVDNNQTSSKLEPIINENQSIVEIQNQPKENNSQNVPVPNKNEILSRDQDNFKMITENEKPFETTV